MLPTNWMLSPGRAASSRHLRRRLFSLRNPCRRLLRHRRQNRFPLVRHAQNAMAKVPQAVPSAQQQRSRPRPDSEKDLQRGGWGRRQGGKERGVGGRVKVPGECKGGSLGDHRRQRWEDGMPQRGLRLRRCLVATPAPKLLSRGAGQTGHAGANSTGCLRWGRDECGPVCLAPVLF